MSLLASLTYTGFKVVIIAAEIWPLPFGLKFYVKLVTKGLGRKSNFDETNRTVMFDRLPNRTFKDAIFVKYYCLKLSDRLITIQFGLFDIFDYIHLLLLRI